MNNKKESVAVFSPIVSSLTLAVLKYIKSTKICREEKVCIHADLVPKVSERVVQASMRPQRMQFRPVPRIEPPIVRRDMAPLVAPIRQPMRNPSYPPQIIVQPRNEIQMPMPINNSPTEFKETEIVGDYGKINNFLRDPAISTIECPGPGKPVSIVRVGQKQMTRISLSPTEIEDILKKVSDSAHIPLLEGVFRAAADNFTINAVVSDMIGSRFLIKKNTPYSLLNP